MTLRLQPSLYPHHDGSELFVSNSAPKIGDFITLKVRIPLDYAFAKAFVRVYHDGEPRSFELVKDSEDKIESWWKVKVEIVNTSTIYRFVFIDRNKYEWLNAAGIYDYDVHSNCDFQIVALPAYPDWIKSSVFYQIFPDRFAKSGESHPVPDWARLRDWNQLPEGKSKNTGTELFGGDLKGVEQHLDHITDLGVNGIYFTPFFSAKSNHRYDANSFDDVDPALGGNKAMFSLMKAAKKKKIRLLGDLTSNHCGAGHPWLAKAIKDKKSKEREFFYWDKSIKHGYVGWWGLASLPKLNFNSKELRKKMYLGKNSVVKKWISPKYGMAGWRIDVGNMTGRLGKDDLHDEVMQGIRKAMDESNPDAWLVAENGDFVASDLSGFGWHGAMNYQGFMRPMWNWINQNSSIGGGFQGLPFSMPKISGHSLVQSMNTFKASIPWRSLVASMVLLDSHDTARMRTVVMGDKKAHLSAMAAMLTYPGVPSIFAGDEIGLEGAWGEDSRRTINWDDRSAWDYEFYQEVTALISLRRSNNALINGGLRWVAIEDDFIVYLRESKRQSLLILISRCAVDVEIDLSTFNLQIVDVLYGVKQSGAILKVSSQSAVQGIWEVTK